MLDPGSGGARDQSHGLPGTRIEPVPIFQLVSGSGRNDQSQIDRVGSRQLGFEPGGDPNRPRGAAAPVRAGLPGICVARRANKRNTLQRASISIRA